MDEAIDQVVVISPHLDDAVFGCGELLASRPGSVVITVFAGAPTRYDSLTPWDETAGFSSGEDVVAARREEDRRALDHVAATPVWLPYLDSQYATSPAADTIADSLEAAIMTARLDRVFIPLGLFHADHALARAAALIVRGRRPRWHWFAYEEAIYRVISGLLDEGLRSLPGSMPFHSDAVADAPQRKRRAVECYVSQLRALATPASVGFDDAFAPERYWKLPRD